MPEIISSLIDVYPFCIIDGQPRYLTLLRTPGVELGNTWQAVHGRINKRESGVQAAVRELIAQVGVYPTRVVNVDYINSFYSPEEDAIYMAPSIGALLPADVQMKLTPDHVNWEWTKPEVAVQRFMWIGERLALQTLHDEIAMPMAMGRQPNPYLQVSPSLYLSAGKGKR